MAVTTVASIYIGTYEITLKVFEFTARKNLRTIDDVRSRIGIGDDVMKTGTIGYETVEQLCNTLKEFLNIAKSYKAISCDTYSAAAIRDAKNQLFVLNQIQIRTGISVKILSNSENRFLSYASVAGSELFAGIADHNSAIVDVGGSGIQITLFKEGDLITTQHMDIGSLRLRELIHEDESSAKLYQKQMEEFIFKKLDAFRAMYLSHKVEYIVLINDYGQELIDNLKEYQEREKIVPAERFLKYTGKLLKKNPDDFTRELSLKTVDDPLLLPTVILFRCITKALEADYICAPGTNINDGIAFDYGRTHSLIRVEHDYEADVLSAARYLAEHYHSFSPHIEALNDLASQIFAAMKKVHGLNRRHLLLLRVATLLHDVGKYISLSNDATSAYNIIMSCEIIGLTHRERQTVALTVLFNSEPLVDPDELPDPIDEDSYLVAAKLASILRVANALDQSHKQKFGNVKISLKERELVITVESTEDISLEKALFTSKTDFFENVFAVKPILKEKRVYNYILKD